MDFRFTEEQLARKQEYHRVCIELAEKAPSTWMSAESKGEYDECAEYHRYCAREFGRRGWLALSWPEEYGGSGDMMDKVLFTEACGYHNVPGIDEWGVMMLAPTLLAAGSEEIKREFLPGIASGETMWCQLWSEPNAGSDLAALNCTAIRKGDEFIVNGQKTWNTCAHRADWGFGIYKSDPSGKKHHNLTFLLCDMLTPGITLRPIPYMDGEHIYNETYFDDVRIPARFIVGKENEGWAVMNVLAGFERSNIYNIATLVRVFEILVEYCNVTQRNGKSLSKDPLVRNRIAGLACELEAVRMLSYRVADQQARNEMGLMDAASVKVFMSELFERMADTAMDIMGIDGQVKPSKYAKMSGMWQYISQLSYALIISMGTNEIQRNLIAWYGLGLPRMK